MKKVAVTCFGFVGRCCSEVFVLDKSAICNPGILEFGGSTLCLDQSANGHPSGCEICRLDGGRAGLEGQFALTRERTARA